MTTHAGPRRPSNDHAQDVFIKPVRQQKEWRTDRVDSFSHASRQCCIQRTVSNIVKSQKHVTAGRLFLPQCRVASNESDNLCADGRPQDDLQAMLGPWNDMASHTCDGTNFIANSSKSRRASRFQFQKARSRPYQNKIGR